MSFHTTEATIIATFEQVFIKKGLPVPHLESTTLLDDSLGLESLDFAEIVVRLEVQFGKDPFASGQLPAVRTLGDLVRLYQ